MDQNEVNVKVMANVKIQVKLIGEVKFKDRVIVKVKVKVQIKATAKHSRQTWLARMVKVKSKVIYLEQV